MRIIGGSRKGSKLEIPKRIRPTQGVVRKSIFDSLGAFIEGRIFLDLYAGSGAVGIESLSRGAREAWFVEKTYEGCKTIEKNLENLGLRDKGKVFRGDSIRYLRFFHEKGYTFDVIFADPPYSYNRLDELLKAVVKVMREDAIFILQSSKTKFFDLVPHLNLLKEVEFGETRISYFSCISGKF